MKGRIKIRLISRYTADIKTLYEACGWISYTKDAHMLENASKHSLSMMGAYDGETLVGFARAVGDGHSILYIQDLLLLPAYRRHGLGSNLLQALILRYPGVYQTVLMTDDTPGMQSFYEQNGFARTDSCQLATYVRIHRT